MRRRAIGFFSSVARCSAGRKKATYASLAILDLAAVAADVHQSETVWPT